LSEFFSDSRILRTLRKASLTDPYEFSLQLREFSSEERIFIATQIAARQKARDKIPDFYADNQIFYPSALSVEQASSSVAAHYKARLVSGGTLIDMTGGLGVDSFYFSKKADKVIYLEIDRLVAAYAVNNFKRLEMDQVEVIQEDSLAYIHRMKEKASYIYVDPSRRHGGRKVFRIEESEPDALAIHRSLLEKARIVIIKLSPFLDIRYLIENFYRIRQIHVVAIDQDCRELLLVLDRENSSADPRIIAWSMENHMEQEFVSTLGENEIPCEFDDPGAFIYDPDVSVRKSGLFNSLGNRFNLKKLAPNSHLYTGDTIVTNFPGRKFHLEKILTFREFLKMKTLTRAHIAVRNFHLRPVEIRKRSGIGEGGDIYIFCTTTMENKPVVLVTRKAALH
jgi:16S rRNA G966 N2-methylase RsmD